jgi:8-oxo-dGTP pyrophosphatase MutT (NUDIX family)
MPEPESVIPFDALPPRFAETLENPPARPVEPRPAATIVLLREGDAGTEVLLLRRNRRSGFVPGAYVFPGGRVDGSDADDELLARVDGLSPEAAAERLSHADDEPPAIAFYLAALREAFEETGILVGHHEDGKHPPTAAESPEVDALRDDLMEDRITFAQALDRMECRIEGTAVAYLAHWITPEVEPRRYDTRFFAAAVPRGAEAIIDPREMTDALWLTPSDALDRNDEGRLPMVFPTIKTLERLARYDGVDDTLRELRRRDVPAILPRLVTTPTGVGMELDEEP